MKAKSKPKGIECVRITYQVWQRSYDDPNRWWCRWTDAESLKEARDFVKTLGNVHSVPKEESCRIAKVTSTTKLVA